MSRAALALHFVPLLTVNLIPIGAVAIYTALNLWPMGCLFFTCIPIYRFFTPDRPQRANS